jgi:hypothetical protein
MDVHPPTLPGMSAIELQTHLSLLKAERAAAALDGLTSDAAYLATLEEEIAATRGAYVGAAVTEIATLGAELWGPNVG